MSDMLIPRPANLTVHGDKALAPVDGDVFNICNRIKEIDSRLRIVLHEGHQKPWVVLEMCADGEERFVSRYEELDSRILTDLQRMLAVPFMERVEKLSREIDAKNAQHGRMTEEQIDQLAHAFRKAAVESNMIDPKWGRSYRKVN